MTTLDQITDKLLATFSESNLKAIALKVSDKYNDDAVSNTLTVEPPVLKTIKDTNKAQSALFAIS